MTNVSQDSRIMNEEPFGPLAPISSFSKMEEVIQEANRLDYGLAAYAYTNSNKKAQELGAGIESGQVSINHHGLGLVDTPFGGVKDSGYGSEGGPEGLDAYMTVKLVSQTGMINSTSTFMNRWVIPRKWVLAELATNLMIISVIS